MADSALSVAETRAIKQFGHDSRISVELIRNQFMRTGTVGLWWDAKVSEEDRQTWWYFHLCLFRLSDRRAVLNEIQKYIDFYGRLENMTILSFEEVDNLDSETKHFLLETKARMRTTRSKTIYDVCKEFVSSDMERNIEKIRNTIGSLEFRKLKNKFDEMFKKEAKEMRLELDSLMQSHRLKAEEEKRISKNMTQEIEDIENRTNDVHSALVGIVQCLEEERANFTNGLVVD